jgi:osmotically-inducible protein OsmY
VGDDELERMMRREIHHEWWASRYSVTVEAVHGVLRLAGTVASPAERSALVAMARSLRGCAGVEDRLTCDTDWREPARIV